MRVTRYNFETNSSSMHSLIYRKEGGKYSDEELRLTEERKEKLPKQDVILVTNDEGKFTNEEIRNSCWCWNGKAMYRGYHLEFQYSAMRVLSSFNDKVEYVLAYYGEHDCDKFRPWEDDYQFDCKPVEDVFKKYMPDITIEVDVQGHRVGINSRILDDFLQKHNISVEDFLVEKKYIVVVDFEEFYKMRKLNMVDMDKVVEFFGSDKLQEMIHALDNRTLQFEDGVWKLNEDDLTFGRSPFKILGTPEGKARYMLAKHCADNIEEITSILQKVYPELREIELPIDSRGHAETGYVDDYQDMVPMNASLEEFLLDKEYIVVVDGDEYCIYRSFVKAGLLNPNEFGSAEFERNDLEYADIER